MGELATPELELVADLRVEIGPPIELGGGPKGERRVIPITGGRVEGPGLCGRILPGGADTQLVRADGVAEIDASYVIEADDGALVHVRNVGVRHGPPEVLAAIRRGEPVDPSLVYFRTVPIFETASEAHGALTRGLFVGTGARQPDHVALRFFRVT
jgi:Protein of unknown function (DUF3237)